MDDFFKDKAMLTAGIYNLSPLQAQKLCHDGAILVDVRAEHLNRYKIFDVTNLIFCPLNKILQFISALPADKPLIIADASGIHSPGAVKILMQNGFAGNCANLSGGLVGWEHSGLPIKINYNERIPGEMVIRQKP